MKYFAPILILLLSITGILHAQEIPSVVEILPSNEPNYSTGPHPLTMPIFPGCETFKENNDSLNHCFRNQMKTKISEKLLSRIDALDSIGLSTFRTIVQMKIDKSGKIEEISTKGNSAAYNEIVLQEMNKIAQEIKGIIPAKQEDGLPVAYIYSIPVRFVFAE